MCEEDWNGVNVPCVRVGGGFHVSLRADAAA